MVAPNQELMLVSEDGILIRTKVDSISLLGRNTQGVTVMKVGDERPRGEHRQLRSGRLTPAAGRAR